ncbi:dipeptidyl peptidase 9-like [Orbicella faveolata]|uniref:dipeptidyl peptidase 9-like n=1 Tax=Orbicella faveolata TaxID=48498 RepID=UPI0009E326FE|nr:dipeptidyl peptidase 9-like [Orbicella faveolata]
MSEQSPFGERGDLRPRQGSFSWKKNGKKSWKDLQAAVKQTKSVQQSLVNRVPHSFTFCENKLYFLAVPFGSRENTIHYVDLPGPNRSSIEEPIQDELNSPLSWKPLLDSFKISRSFSGYSREEQLLRERKRLGAFGITAYDFDETCRRFMFSASSSLYTCTDWRVDEEDENRQPIIPEELNSQTSETKMDAKLCPCDPNLVAFIHRNDIWINSIVTEEERRLTYTNQGTPSPMEEPVSAGVASFIVQEEFDRYTGYWWQPKFSTDESLTRTYRILFEEVDESSVEILHIVSGPDSMARNSHVDSYRYPKAGSANAKSKLKIVEFSIDTSGKICDHVIEYQMRVPLSEAFPFMEYLVRCGWLPDGESVYAEILDRNQQHLAMVQIPVAFFVPINLPANQLLTITEGSPMIEVLAEESNDIWINVADLTHFLRMSDSRLQFIWSSEISGYRHLYLATANSNHTLTRARAGSFIAECCIHYPLVTQRQLTDGDWEVDGKEIWVDENRKLIYFMGTKDTPIEQHLYVVSYVESDYSEPQRLTQSGYSHAVSLNESFTKFVTVFSSIKETQAVMVYQLNHDEVEMNNIPLITVEPVAELLRSSVIPDYQPPELFSYESKHGHQVYGMMFKPPIIEPGVKYPTVLFLYGGPHVQLVTNAHKGYRFLRLHTIAKLGYVVVVMDCRGSAHRGLQFEGHIKNRLGQVEIEDQVEGLEYVAKATGFVDLSRIAIHGWSYGGYLSLLGLVQRPEIFKVAIVGAPVTTWSAYDTGYTERYMSTPAENPLGYKMSSVLNYANRFPDEENRLLLVHGLIDENVHFYHSSLLISELIKACKPYQLLIYPNERHGIRQSVSSEHYETMLLSFLQKNL